MGDYQARGERLRHLLRKAALEPLLVTAPTNVTYLTGFTGADSYLLVTPHGQIMLSDPRYTTQLEQECPGLDLEIRRPGSTMLERVVQVVQRGRFGRLGIEAGSMRVGLFDALGQALPAVELVRTFELVERLRVIKDRDEIGRIRRAAWQARRAFEVIRAGLRPEQSEVRVAADLEHQLRLFGARGASFPPIVAAGPRAALPHASPTQALIGAHDFTLVDWGANEGLYVSDLTRILVVGRISPKLQKIYGVVLRAQAAAIDAIRPGASAAQVDEAARRVIARAGYGDAFAHGLGHGIGLQVHEAPRLARDQNAALKPGMVVTVEPGIYLPGWGGIRIEDDVLVTRSGHEVLTAVPKQLDECVVA
ncbi:MAG: aminopeptidase [Planctomycetes bacterium RBG_16_64_10]|nr:MAG: aminopeptidase [Planctomycetes bacterium RBG_16_64_10]